MPLPGPCVEPVAPFCPFCLLQYVLHLKSSLSCILLPWIPFSLFSFISRSSFLFCLFVSSFPFPFFLLIPSLLLISKSPLKFFLSTFPFLSFLPPSFLFFLSLFSPYATPHYHHLYPCAHLSICQVCTKTCSRLCSGLVVQEKEKYRNPGLWQLLSTYIEIKIQFLSILLFSESKKMVGWVFAIVEEYVHNGAYLKALATRY